MNLLEKIKKREMEFNLKDLFDVSDTREVVNNNYNAIVNEIHSLNCEITNLNPIDTGKKFMLNKIIVKYEKYKDELLELCKVFNDSKINYGERLNILLSLRISYQIKEESAKIIFDLKKYKEN